MERVTLFFFNSPQNGHGIDLRSLPLKVHVIPGIPFLRANKFFLFIFLNKVRLYVMPGITKVTLNIDQIKVKNWVYNVLALKLYKHPNILSLLQTLLTAFDGKISTFICVSENMLISHTIPTGEEKLHRAWISNRVQI